ncbi:DUF4493 domain-containing protein [Bacteroides hominis]|uniref:DUF4493 domain-containing protein n=1 Tax=Bacteroides hominis TaxID=2763023 RepID=UPI00164C2DBC|nr:DUF4493 domain-containing protein [Bacteroides hominis (ex Liu et al. 2022)]MBC5612804.1 DUF4493 domain-containing protein [Bacteroides hominis (ex Liu et al. 2022)]MCS2833180.1 DUF4493 domain-containing protein [Bacteroides fragilis]
MKRYIYLFVSVFTLVMASCQQEETSNGKTGYLQFSVEKNTSTILVPATRAEELPIALQVVDRAGTVVKETDDWHNWTSTPLELPLGSYTINAFSKGVDVATAGFDEPYYWGQTEVTVVPKVNQNVNIECRLANVKVTVNYSADVKKYFSKLSCSVGNSSGKLVFGKDETRSGYFAVDNLNISLALTNTDGRSFVFESEPITDVKERQHYRINYTMKANGAIGGVSVTLDPSTKEYNVNISIPKESNPSVNVWSDFADVTLPLPDGVVTKECKYRISGTEDWNTVSNVEQADGKLIATITGLIPGTEYDFCFAINGVNGKITTATTELQKQLENGSFDEWNQNGDTWFPGTAAEASAKNSYWDTGNVGAATMSKNPSIGESNDVHTVGGKSGKLSSQFVGLFGVGKFAAGNIYIGRYMETYANVTNMGARIRFGREFSSRPTELKGWYKYTRGKDKMYGDYNKSELTDSGGDKCSIYIVLTDNIGLVDADGVKTAYEIDNHATDQPAKFIYKNAIDFSENNKDVIAYGSITDEESKGSFDESGNVVWKQFSIDLKYRDLTRKPKFIIVVASASKYGDFFTGYENSTMLIDDFELVYGTPVTAN